MTENFKNECKEPAYANRLGKIIYKTKDTKITNKNTFDSNGEPLKSLTVYGKCEQEIRNGKNVLNVVCPKSGTKSGITWIVNEDNSITLSGTTTENFYLNLNNVDNCRFTLTNGKVYTSFLKAENIIEGTPTSVGFTTRSSSQNYTLLNWISGNDCITSTYQYATDSNCWSYLEITKNKTINLTVYPMILEGDYSADTAYEKYGKTPSVDYPSEIKTVNVISVDLLQYVLDESNTNINDNINLNNNELCSIDDIFDELDIVSGGLTKRISKITFDGSESWYKSGSCLKLLYSNISKDDIKPFNNSVIPPALCNYFLPASASSLYRGTVTEGFSIGEDGVYFANNNISASDWKTWLSENPVTVYYIKQNPETITLDSHVIETFERTNNITINSNIPTTHSIEYYPYTEITGDDYLVNYEVLDDCYVDGNIIGTTNAKSIKINTLDNYELSDGEIEAYIGVKYDDSTTEYLNMGKYTVDSENNQETLKNGEYNGLDILHKLNEPYICGITDYETTQITIADVYNDLCHSLGYIPKTLEFINSDLPVSGNPFTNREKYRDVLSDIAEVACSFVEFDEDEEEIDLVWFDEEISETLTKDDYATLTLNKQYGPVNSVVIKESQIEGENVVMQDEDDITKNGETQIAIKDNYFLYNEDLRRQAIPAIYERLKGFTYQDCTITTDLGKPFLKCGNKIEFEANDGTMLETYVLKHAFKFDGAFHSTIESPALTESETRIENNYETPKENFRRVEVEVNKIKGEIQSIIEDSDDNYSQIMQDVEKVVTSIQKSGGNNLLQNSVMFACKEDGTPNNWTLSGDGILTIQTNAESTKFGGISGQSFTLNNKSVIQRINVKQDNVEIPENEKTYYTFSTKIKKKITGTCYVKISNDKELYTIELGSGVEAQYEDYEIKALLPQSDYYNIEFYGSVNSDATFTDNMFSVGQYKSSWTQANGEIMNTQVQINVDGILVKSLIYDGDYTIMSPLEFAGYSKINGVLTKVFSLNKDTTIVKKLEVEDQIKMPPIKIVPITEGETQGWAFVASTGRI